MDIIRLVTSRVVLVDQKKKKKRIARVRQIFGNFKMETV